MERVPRDFALAGAVLAGSRRDKNDTESMARDIGKKRQEVMVLELPHVR